ncbi:MAG: type II toxin-antitoxin system RelE/ParE family toxin [Desulfobacterales bacterium]|nr:type II toxin-antitoxin system RelE/ParE family toxin [Desulfobacterales bacterium]
MYEVLLERRAERDIKKLPEETFHRIIPHLKALSENPKPSGCRKITGSKNDWRIRIGDYRLIYEIDARAKAVKVMRIRHRKDAYR